MPNIEHMRSAISDAYPGEGWKFRCQYMKDSQVIAIYGSLMRRGVFDGSGDRKFIPFTKGERARLLRAGQGLEEADGNTLEEAGRSSERAGQNCGKCTDARKNKLDMVEPSGETWVQLSMF